jgi:protein-disulfide isomerase
MLVSQVRKIPSIILIVELIAVGGPLAVRARAADAPRISPEQDAQLKAYLQKRFHIADVKQISLSSAVPSPFPHLWARTVTVTPDQGPPVKVEMFTNATEDKVIIGQYLDLHSDPWGRIPMSRFHLKDRAMLGPENAPVTIIEFADFECPFCARAFSEVETMVNDRYKGKVKLYFKNFPLAMHPWARQAAIAAECIRRQNPQDFWDFAQVIYTSQSQIDPSNLRQRIDAYASANKLDQSVLNACMMGKSAEAQIAQDQLDGVAAHVMSTPTFFVDGIPVVGLPEQKVFDFVVNSELKSKQEQASK